MYPHAKGTLWNAHTCRLVSLHLQSSELPMNMLGRGGTIEGGQEATRLVHVKLPVNTLSTRGIAQGGGQELQMAIQNNAEIAQSTEQQEKGVWQSYVAHTCKWLLGSYRRLSGLPPPTNQ